MKHRWRKAYEPEQFGPQRDCKVCGLTERTDVGPLGHKIRVWQWLCEFREFLDMPACPGRSPQQTDAYTFQFVTLHRRQRRLGSETAG